MDKIKRLSDIEKEIAKNKERRNYLQFIKLPEIQGEIAMLERTYIHLYIDRGILRSEKQ